MSSFPSLSPKFTTVNPPPRFKEVRGDAKRNVQYLGNEPIILLENLLSSEECKYFIKHAEELGFQSLQGEFPQEYRDNERILGYSAEIASNIFSRIVSTLTFEDVLHSIPMQGGSGMWVPLGVNECIKFAKYSPGGKFKPHIDGPWSPAINQITIWTIVIYLNDAHDSTLEGGETNFLQNKNSTRNVDNKQPLDEIDESLHSDYNVLKAIHPKTGNALMFRHHLLHEGSPVLKGVKYIIRSELIFSAIPSLFTTDTQGSQLALAKKISEKYELSDSLYSQQGQERNFVSTYLQALKLQEQTVTLDFGTTGWSAQILWAIFLLLDLPTLGNCFRVCKLWYRLLRNGYIWQTRMARERSNMNRFESQTDIPVLSIDWWQRYKQHTRDQRATLPARAPAGLLFGGCSKSSQGFAQAPRLPQTAYLDRTARAFQAEDQIPAISIDNGSYMIKAGFCGDDHMKSEFPTVVGRPRHQGHSLFIGMGQRDSYVGDEALMKRGIFTLKYPIEHGIVTNWDDMEKIWHHTFYNELRVAPEEHMVILSESMHNPSANREMMAQIMFETFNTPVFGVGANPTFALYTHGCATGVIVETGHSRTDVVPYYEWMPVRHAAVHADSGGQAVAETLGHLLDKNKVFTPVSRFEMQLIADIKEKICYVAPNLDHEMQCAVQNPVMSQQKDDFRSYIEKRVKSESVGFVIDQVRKSSARTYFSPEVMPEDILRAITGMRLPFRLPPLYELPDGQMLQLTTEQFQSTEPLFSTNFSLPRMVSQALSQVHRDLIAKPMSKVMLCGGNSMLPGLANRVASEIQSDVPLRFVENPDRKYASWIGSSLFGSLSTALDSCFSKELYDENGPSLVHSFRL